jgi:hypothetical protein
MRKNYLSRPLLAFAFLLAGSLLWRCTPASDAIKLGDQPVAAFWQIDLSKDEGRTVGDHILLTLNVFYIKEIKPPEINIQPVGEFSEMVSQASSKPHNRQGISRIETLVEIIYWSPGEHTSPPVVVAYTDRDGQPQTLPVNEISIQINSVLTPEEIQKKDIKPQAELPRPPIWFWVLMAVFAASLLYGLLLWLGQRFRQPTLKNAENLISIDPRPPEEIALAELARIESLELPGKSEYKLYYTLVTDCIRCYFEALFIIPALDRTTNEFLYEIKQAGMDQTVIQAASYLLSEADLVKFAKATPTVSTARQYLIHARSLIKDTRPDREAEKAGESQ